MGYSGYANYETWNVNMFLGLEPYCSLLSEYCRKPGPTYLGFVDFAELRGKATSDGVSFTDPKLDLVHLDGSVAAYRSDTFGYREGGEPRERGEPTHLETVRHVADALRGMSRLDVVACAGDGSGEGALLAGSCFDIIADDGTGPIRLVCVDTLPFSDTDAPLGCDWVGEERAKALLEGARRFRDANSGLFGKRPVTVDFAELTTFTGIGGAVMRYHANVRKGRAHVDRSFEKRVLEAISSISGEEDQLPIGPIMPDDAGMPLFAGIPDTPRGE